MTTARRVLAVLGLALAVVVGGSVPASAGFGDTAGVGTTLATQLVAAPGDVSGDLTCSEPHDSFLTLTWTRSSTPRVVTYRVTLHHNDGSVTSRNLPATSSSWTTDVPNHRLKQGNSFQASVTTLTDYGWSTQSPLTGSFTC
jgi:hypothetical protein